MRVYLLAWLGLLAIAFANAALRELTYGPAVTPLAAEWISTLTAIGAMGVFIWWVVRRWPAQSRRHALAIGAIWVAMTVAFEAALGLATGRTWADVAAMYELWNKRPWVLLLAWVGALPWIATRARAANGQ